MMDEDLTIKAVNDAENRQTLLYGMGDQHLSVIVSTLAEKYKSRSGTGQTEGGIPRDAPEEIRCGIQI